MKHDSEEVMRSFFEKLGSRARHVVYLLGAGASCAANLPDLEGLKCQVSSRLQGGDKERFGQLGKTRNLEEILSRLRLIGEAVAGGDETLGGLTSEAAKLLDEKVCGAIAQILTETQVDLTHHEHFAQWIGASEYDRALEIVTTNYDLLIERGLEAAGVPYFDGFVGTYSGRFRPDLVDEDMSYEGVRLPNRWARVWKVHGSVSWGWLRCRSEVCGGGSNPQSRTIRTNPRLE